MKSVSVLHNERGAILITGLVLLIVLTLIGITAMQSSTLQERMAGNLEQQDMAFQAAEAGLRDAEAWLNNTVVLPAFNGTNGFYTPAAVGAIPNWKSVDWANAAEVRVYQAGDLGDPPPYDLPRYIIEYMTPVDMEGNDSLKFSAKNEDGYAMYRITSRGDSPNGLGEVFLQTTFIR